MLKPSIDWNTAESLPLETNPIYTYITKTLLPINPLVNKPRQVRVNCTLYDWKITKPATIHSNSSNYWTHLKIKHPKEYRQLKEASNSDSISISNSDELSTNSSTINTPFTLARRFSTIESIELRRLITRFIIANNLSFRVSTSETFRDLLYRLNPTIPRISYDSIIRDISNYYMEKLEAFKNQLLLHKTQNKGTFTLTIDSWTTKSQHAFFGITIHWIDALWVLNTRVLRLLNLKRRHTGEYMNKLLVKTLKEFNILDRIYAITRDNASNNDTLISEFKTVQQTIIGNQFKGEIRCLAHILNLII